MLAEPSMIWSIKWLNFNTPLWLLLSSKSGWRGLIIWLVMSCLSAIISISEACAPSMEHGNILGLVSLFNGISSLFRLFNAKAILQEEQ